MEHDSNPYVERRLPTPDELVSALRSEYCSATAPFGTRDPNADAIVGRHTTATDHRKWVDQRQLIARLAQEDPIHAALTAESFDEPIWAACCWVLAGDIEGALATMATIPVGETNGYHTQTRIEMSLVLGHRLAAEDVLSLHSSMITQWGKNHGSTLAEIIQFRIDEIEERGESMSSYLLSLEDLHWLCGWNIGDVFEQTSERIETLGQPQFGASRLCRDYFVHIVRQAENDARDAAGQFRVGEGWISETELYLLIKNSIGQLTEVIQHGRPIGFGQQHLDVWLPDWRIGIEYQGIQHFESVEYFGGDKGFQKTQARDAAKRAKCVELDIALIEVRPDYDEEKLIAKILDMKP